MLPFSNQMTLDKTAFLNCCYLPTLKETEEQVLRNDQSSPESEQKPLVQEHGLLFHFQADASVGCCDVNILSVLKSCSPLSNSNYLPPSLSLKPSLSNLPDKIDAVCRVSPRMDIHSSSFFSALQIKDYVGLSELNCLSALLTTTVPTASLEPCSISCPFWILNKATNSSKT